MFVSMKMIFYFCNVKLTVRYIAAALRSVFCACILLVNSKRIEWGNGNVPEALAQLSLTTRNALSLCLN